MSLWPNPAVAPPLLSPGRNSIHHQSPSRSPVRSAPRDIDPLLRDLSPTNTLRSFSSNVTEAQVPGFDAISSAERALGIKAAHACLSLRSWCRELESWEWRSGFEPSGVAASEPARLATCVLEQKWTCLTNECLESYDRRVQEISRELNDIDVDELKDFALSAHHFTSPDGVKHHDNELVLKRLEDYTALITATILQALPFLSRVVRSLNVWIVRLAVCRKAPRYLQDLLKAKLNLDQASEEVRKLTIVTSSSLHSSLDELDQSQDAVATRKTTLAAQIASLGTRLDSFLDDLEGRDETVPDFWIDEFEAVETSYSTWAAQADTTLLKCESFRNRHLDTSRNELPLHASLTDTVGHGILYDKEAVVGSETRELKPTSVQGGLDQNDTEEERQEFSTISDTNIKNQENDNSSVSSSKRPRHIPIILDYDGYPVNGITGDSGGSLGIAPRASEQRLVGPSLVPLHKRSPFLNGQIERAESLQKPTKTPVRPFEHASTAFTRLFKKDKPVEQPDRRPSNGSLRSNTSVRVDFEALARGRQPSLTPVSVRSQMFDSDAVAEARLSRSVSSRNNRIDVDRSTSRPKIVTRNISRYAAETAAEHHSAISASQTLSPASSAPTSSPKLLSSPFPPSTFPEQPPENWPLRSPSPSENSMSPSLQFNSDSRILPNPGVHSPSRARGFSSPSDSSPRLRSTSSLMSLKHRPELHLATQLAAEDSTATTLFHRRQISEGSQSLDSQLDYSLTEVPRAVIAGPAEPRDDLQTNTVVQSIENKSVEDVKNSVHNDFMRRASYTSIEAHPRSAVKSIQVIRRTSFPPQTASAQIGDDEDTVIASVEPSPGESSEVYQFPSPPSSRIPRLAGSRPSSVDHSRPNSSATNILPSSPVNLSYREEGNQGLSSPKVTVTKQRQAMHSPTSAPASPSPIPHRRSHNQSQDSFDRHVSDVVQRLHSNIRFSRSGAETPVSATRGTGIQKQVVKTRGERQSLSTGHTMTIAPAESTAKRSSTTAEPVKLYHLRQEGREDPIKLFVRLVGEDERVMVRVGGGWSDLADYLCQYAEHHASRTVSGNVLEVLPADTNENLLSGTGGIRRVSASTDHIRAKTPVTPGGRAAGAESNLSRPISRDEIGGSPAIDASSGSPFLPTVAHTAAMTAAGGSSARSTPRSFAARNAFVNSNNNNNSSRPSTPEVSSTTLAGARRSTGPSSDHKARWVEGMIEKARASADQDKGRGDRDKHFGDMGRIGGTRRVIFRSSSGAGGFGGADASK